MSQLVDAVSAVLCICLLLMVLARGSAATISPAHCRPWVRRRDVRTGWSAD